MKKWIPFVILLVLLAACGGQSSDADEYLVYFTEGGETAYGAAIGSELFMQGDANPDTLLQALLAGPTDPTLTSPFVSGITLLGWHWSEEVPGLIEVDFSEHYSGLTGISLTLADYCVALTLCQLEGVDCVEITSAGRTINYRSHQLLSPEDAIFSFPAMEATSP